MRTHFLCLLLVSVAIQFGSMHLFGQDLRLSYDTLNQQGTDFAKMKSNFPVVSYVTRFGTEVKANVKLIVGSPAKSDGFFISFLNDHVPGSKLGAEGHKSIGADFGGNFLVIKEMVTLNPVLEAQMQAEENRGRVIAQEVQMNEGPKESDDEKALMEQNELVVVAYAIAPNGSQMTITDLERAIEIGELIDPNIPSITEEMRAQLQKIDGMLERGEITAAKHKKLQNDILQSGVGK